MNNKKSILFLINGFGSLQKDSYDFDIDVIMPNLAKICRSNIYTSLENDNANINEGYEELSLGSSLNNSYHFVEKEIQTNFVNNKILNYALEYITSKDVKLHIYLVFKNDKVVDQLRGILSFIRENYKFSIFIHIILNSNKVEDYKKQSFFIGKLKQLCSGYDKVSIGLIFGINQMSEERASYLYKIIVSEIGERWPDYERKLNTLQEKGIKPEDMDAFFITDGFKVSSNDMIWFLNYEIVNYSCLINVFNNPSKYFSLDDLPTEVKFMSLFPMGSNREINYMYDFVKINETINNTLHKIRANALVLTDNDRVSTINYYFNGMKNIDATNIKYATITNNKNVISNILSDDNYHFIIFDTNIGNASSVEAITITLHDIDKLIGIVYNMAIEKGIYFYITSVYGMNEKCLLPNGEMGVVNFSNYVFAVVSIPTISKGKYTLEYGNIYDFMNTILCNINQYSGRPTILCEKSLFTIFNK
ncbi:MAG: hypothetical protein Q4G04_05320 [bacterium]|nr:hypothetical protein [bacterium]